MSQIGEKRPAEKQIGPEDEEDRKDTASQKRSVPGFVFRPSSLQKATQGFALKQATLEPAPSKPTKPAQEKQPDTSRAPPGGFLKLNSDEIKPITITTPTIMLARHGSGGWGNQTVGRGTNGKGNGQSAENHNDTSRRENPFLQFLSPSCPPTQSFSSLSSTGASAFSPVAANSSNSSRPTEATLEHSTPDNKEDSHDSETESTGLESDPLRSSPQLPFGSQPATAILPKIQTPTGEEGEKKIVQVPARLYAFDVTTHSWKERGRGEVRLNDASQSEGVFQSRLVMRASGSYRVLLNTHLWAQMKCDRANQKSIRITAQSTEGKISVFLMMGAAKDVQQLFTAIDRRIEALRRNVQHSQEGSEQQNEAFRSAATALSFDEDDKESFLDEPHSSPESSPEAHSSTRLRQVEANPVPVPGQHSGSSGHSSIASAGDSDCEGGRESGEEGEKVEEEEEERKCLSEESSAITATTTSSSDVSQEPT